MIPLWALPPVTLLLTMGGVAGARRLALRRRWLDRPDRNRKRHSHPQPIAGFVLAPAVLLPLWLGDPKPGLGLAAGGLLMLALGLDDDLKGRSAWTRLIGQGLIALVPVLGGGVVVYAVTLFGVPIPLGPLAVPLTLLWIVGVTNAVNLIDGLDGLAAGGTAIVAGALSAIAAQAGNGEALRASLGLLGGALGFWVYNRPPARAFLGNGGSYLLGIWLALLSLQAPASPGPGPEETGQGQIQISLLVPLLLLALPLGDTVYAILRRLRAGRPVFAPDRGHVHHRLSARWGTWRALGVLYGVFALCAGLAWGAFQLELKW